MHEAGHRQTTAELCVDAHVHLYPFMSVTSVLNAAERNLIAVDAAAGRGGPRDGLLVVADPEGVRGYERLAADDSGDWERTEVNGASITFRRRNGRTMTAVRGQQLISREGLEVLGTGYGTRLPSGLSLPETVRRIRAAGGLSILAWGVGKWLGRRGRVLDALIASEAGAPDVMLADNAGRPRFWSRVPQFEAAAERGMRVLAGTDPLPLPGEERRVGSYGFRVSMPREAGESMIDALRRALESPEVPLEIVGRQIGAGGFVATQLRLRLGRMSSDGVAS